MGAAPALEEGGLSPEPDSTTYLLGSQVTYLIPFSVCPHSCETVGRGE